MKTAILLLVIISICWLSADQVTIYNDNFSLVRANIEMDLQKGINSYYFDDIPQTIEQESVILKSGKKKFNLINQNYEFDLASTSAILAKYLGKKVAFETEEGNVFSGILQFNDRDYIGFIEDTTQKLILLRVDQISHISLENLPENFFLKPTLHWQLGANATGKHEAEFSYLCRGMGWNVTYNTIYRQEKQELGVNAWVTINNTSGKQYDDVTLKLVAGEVNRYMPQRMYNTAKFAMMEETAQGGSFEEKEFHDFHLYTLSQKVTINNNQTKQIQLFPPAKTHAVSVYKYRTNQTEIKSYIEFENKEKDGLGIPLPAGIIKVYKEDEKDGQMEFIGEDGISHTAKNEKVSVLTGTAFDLVGETVTKDNRRISNRITEKDMEVTLRNQSSQPKTIIIEHAIGGSWQIFNESQSYKKENAYLISFEVTIKPEEEKKISWTERTSY
jgi:hypothetical protein